MRTLRGTVVIGALLLAGCTSSSSGGSERVGLTADEQFEQARAHNLAAMHRQEAREAARRARQQLRAERQAAREARQPRKVYYMIRGSAVNAEITYTATGGGTTQRLIGVAPEWHSAMVRLRPGDFAYVSAQNQGESGSISCRIVESGPDGDRVIAPVTTSDGGYTIVDCNGTVK